VGCTGASTVTTIALKPLLSAVLIRSRVISRFLRNKNGYDNRGNVLPASKCRLPYLVDVNLHPFKRTSCLFCNFFDASR